MKQERKEGGSGPAKHQKKMYPGDQLDAKEWESVTNVIPGFLEKVNE